MAPVAALPRPPPREGAEDAGEDLLQIRGRLAGRQPQAEHRRAPGLLQQGSRGDEDRDRNRRRPVGLLAGLRRRPLRDRRAGVHGPRFLRPEALPSGADGDLWRPLHCLAVERDQFRTHGAGGQPGSPRLASASPSRKRSRWPRPTTTPNTPSARCSITSSSTRPWSARRRWRKWRWPATIPTSSSAAPAAARISPASSSRSSAPSSAAAGRCASSRSNRRPARA